jgi:hypothetical protein
LNILVLSLLLFFHCGVAFFIFFWPSVKIHGRKEYIIPILLVPVFGPLLAATIELLFLLENPASKPVELESLKSGHNLIWAPSIIQQDEK